MLLPSLFQLAVKSVAQQIHNEKIPLDFHLDTKSSNAVVRELFELDPTNIKKLKIYKNQLSSLTELDLSECEIADNEISHFKNFKLKSLEFGPLFHLAPDFPGPTSSDKINIVSLIKRAVNTDSQKTMVHFGISGEEDEYKSGWEEKVSKLLPSLQSIKIIHMEFNERFQFSKFCSSFPNLRVLDISFAENLTTLKGIKRLKHLQKLVMREVEIEDVDGYNELSELKNLRFLDVSDEHDQIIRRLLEAEVRMENLEFLDCSMTCVQEHVLEEFVKCHPKLKTVVAISTGCNDLYIPTIDLLNFNSPYSTVKSLEYALSNDQYELAEDCLNEIMEKLNTIHEQLNDSEIRALLNSVCCVLGESKDESSKNLAIHCFAESSFFENVINPNVPDEKTKALVACLIFSLLLAKNLIDDREYVNRIIGQFNDSWGRWNLPNCLPTWEKYVELNTIFTSEYSTNESIRFGLRLMSTFIYAENHTSNDLWNWMRATSERIRNNENWMKNTRDSASAVLYEMAMSDNIWRYY